MTIRPFNMETDYAMVCEWWKGHGWPEIPSDALPKVGFIVSDEGKDICAGFLYLCESAWGWLEWVVTNPKGPILKRKAGLDVLVNHAVEMASRLGVKRILSSLQNENLISLYEKSGFKKMDTGMTNLLWRHDLWQSQRA